MICWVAATTFLPNVCCDGVFSMSKKLTCGQQNKLNFFQHRNMTPSQHPFGKKIVLTSLWSTFFCRLPYKEYSATHNRLESKRRTRKKDVLVEKINPQKHLPLALYTQGPWTQPRTQQKTEVINNTSTIKINSL